MPPEVCPNCGADVPRNAKACPECGSCEETGWSKEADEGSLGLPDEDFDHGDFVKREFGDKSPKPRGIHWFWWVIGLVVLAVFLMMVLR